MFQSSKFLLCAPLTIVALLSVSPASAAVLGSFTSDGNGQQITITLTDISFGTAPNIKVDASTLTYGLGTLLTTGTLGTIKPADAIPLDDFITFQGTSLDFTLLGLGPGDTSDPHDCSAATSNGKSCSISLAPGVISPVILTFENNTTSASLNLVGTVTDSTGVKSNWTGTLSTTLTADLSQYTSNPNITGAPTPVDIANYFAAHPGGAFTSSNSGSFTVTLAPTVPEPATWSLMLGGMLTGAGALLRRKRVKA